MLSNSKNEQYSLILTVNLRVWRSEQLLCVGSFEFISHKEKAKSWNRLYHKHKNKWYRQRCLLTHFEATFDFSSSEFAST